MADMDANQKVAYFQDVTGIEDRDQVVKILEAHNWDLNSAIQMILALSASDHQDDDNGLGVNSAGAQNTGSVEYRENQFLANGGAASGGSSGSDVVRGRLNAVAGGAGQLPASPRLVWRLVMLPVSIVRGSVGLFFGAVGLSLWAAGSVVNYSVNTLTSVASWVATQGQQHLIQQHQQQMTRRRLLGGGPEHGGVSEASLFLQRFELEYGPAHPAFLETNFMEAVRLAGEQFKFLFVYIHSAEHSNTPAFCRSALCSEPVIRFVDENFVAWGGDVRGSEGFQMSNVLKASTFPFCCIVTGSTGQRVALLQVVEGPKTPEELVEVLRRVLEEQGPMLVAQRMEMEERALSRRLREEQDAAYQAALLADQERELKRKEEAERLQREAAEAAKRKQEEEEAARRAAEAVAEREAALERRRIEKAAALGPEPEKGPDVTQVLIRFPNGDRKERRFPRTAPVQAVYDYVDSLGGFKAVHYSLVSNFPTTVYGPETLSLPLESVGLHPHASLFLQEHDS
eukprot:TRINITY_DN23582_c0_g1_i1.p1 TRINITY_DN23582_c0_g1~~TRINITY_DN23582_c0_g1_i1.p1  ORF type:complete len:513 (-),score=117.01 TRINITY_DN23582_c0_g1_i1:700-2238(-)